MSDWYALSGHAKWQWVVTREKTFQTALRGVKFNHKYFSLDVFGVLTIRKGYMWNGNTGVPLRLEKSILSRMVAASCGHDALYQAIQLKLLPKSYRDACDVFLRTQWIADGVDKKIAWAGYWIVYAVGWTRI